MLVIVLYSIVTLRLISLTLLWYWKELHQGRVEAKNLDRIDYSLLVFVWGDTYPSAPEMVWAVLTTNEESALRREIERRKAGPDMLMAAKNVKLSQAVVPLLDHASGDIRKKAVQILKNQQDTGITDKIQTLVTDNNPSVRREAMHYLYLQTKNEHSDIT